MATYAEQVIICTGKSDWPSNIVEEHDGDNLAADLRELIGPKGKYSDVCVCLSSEPRFYMIACRIVQLTFHSLFIISQS